jgi:hypothetical protein
MRDLAPDIVRQRLLIEGYYTVAIDSAVVERYLAGIAACLGLRTYGAPVVHAPGGAGKEENQGFDAFIPPRRRDENLCHWLCLCVAYPAQHP